MSRCEAMKQGKSGAGVAQPAEVALLLISSFAEAAQPRQVALHFLESFMSQWATREKP